MRLQIVWTTALLIMVTLSGCASEPTNDSDEVEEGFEDYDLEVTDETGIIKGFVLDASINPIQGIKVSLLNTDLNVTTNDKGAYGFAGLQPGAYFLVAEHPDYLPLKKEAVVVAGEKNPENVNFVLERNPVTKPDKSDIQKNGFIACSITSPSVSYAACNAHQAVADLTQNEFINYVTYDMTPDFVQSEMIWTATNELGTDMSLSWTDPSSGAQVGINRSDGPSPLMVTIDRDHWETMNLTGKELWLRVFSSGKSGTDFVEEETWNDAWRNSGYGTYNSTAPQEVKDAQENNFFGLRTLSPFGEDCIKYPVLFDSCYGVGGAGVSFQQDYEIFSTAFFNFLPDEGWKFSEHGAHEIPDE